MPHIKDHNHIVTKRGDSVSNPNHYRSNFERIPSFADIYDAQQELGFHPGGYGPPYDIVITQKGYNLFVTEWKSQGSCD